MNKNKKKSSALSEETFGNVTGGNIYRDTHDDGRVFYSVWSDDKSHLLSQPGMDVLPDSLLPRLLKVFDTEEEAVKYARDHGIDTTIENYRVGTGASNIWSHFNNSSKLINSK